MGGESPVVELYDSGGNPLSVQNGVAIPASTPGLLFMGSDGTNSRYILVDGTSRQIVAGAGTAGTPAGGVITIQGDPSGTPIPISGNITASNASVGTNDAAIPGFSTLIAGSDGTNLRPVRIFDLDSGAGTQWILGVGLRKSAGGGSVELGTASDPIRVDPTGTTTQPVSGTVTANQGGSWTVAATQSGTWTVQPGNTANTTPWLMTINQGGNSATVTASNALKVDGSAVTQPVSGTVTANAGTGNFTVVQSTASNLRAQLASETSTGTAVPSTAVQVGGSDGTNLRPIFLDSSGRQIIIGAAANGAAVAGNPVLVAGSDGTNARSIKTATDGTVRVDPTGTTTQPVSGTVTANIGTTGGLALDATLTGGTQTTRITDGTNTAGVDSQNHLFVSGKSAVGVTPTANPVAVSGVDGGGLKRAFLTDTTGKLSIVGAAADGTAVTGNPVLIGGQDGTNVQSISTDGYGRIQVAITGSSSSQVEGRASDGATPVGNPVLMAGMDGTNVQTLLTTTTGAIRQTPDPYKTIIFNNGTITSSGSTVITNIGYSEIYVIINVKNAPTGTSPTLTFTMTEVDPVDQTTSLNNFDTGTPITGAGVQILQLVDLNGDTIKVSWAITGASASFTGVNVTFSGHVSGNAIEGQAQDGYAVDEGPVIVGGVDSNMLAQYFRVDSVGNLQVVLNNTVGTNVNARVVQNITTNITIYNDYTVPVGKTLSVSSYYVGGGGSVRSSLSKHTASNVTFIANGDFETAGQVAAWAAVTGSFTAPTPDSNSTQFQTGAASMRWTYASSATALARKQTFSPTIDLSGYRYLRVKFFNDAATGTTRTISIIVTSGTSTRTYSLSGTLGTAPFTANTWITLTGDLDNPTSATGTNFDLTSISGITLQMQDAVNKTGTVYWDTLRQEDQLDIRHRLYSSTGDTVSAPLNPAEVFNAGESVYLAVRNISNVTNEYTGIWAGTLV